MASKLYVPSAVGSEAKSNMMAPPSGGDHVIPPLSRVDPVEVPNSKSPKPIPATAKSSVSVTEFVPSVMVKGVNEGDSPAVTKVGTVKEKEKLSIGPPVLVKLKEYNSSARAEAASINNKTTPRQRRWCLRIIAVLQAIRLSNLHLWTIYVITVFEFFLSIAIINPNSTTPNSVRERELGSGVATKVNVPSL